MTSRPPQPIGKSQLYALLVDAAGAPVLDGDGAQQVVAVQSTNGKLQVDASLTGSLTNQTATITIGTGATHAAGDVVSTDSGAIMEFETGLTAGSGGVILGSLTTLGRNAVFSGGAGYDLYLFNASPTVQATNDVLDIADADLSKYIGKITIGTLAVKTSNCVKTDVGHNKPFKLANGSTKLYAKAVCNGGETTVTGKVITFKLDIVSL